MEIVSAVQAALAGKVGKDRYELWFGRGVRMELCGTTLRIAAADSFRLDLLRRSLQAELLAAVRAAAGADITLEFVLDPTLVEQVLVEKKIAEPVSDSSATAPAAGEARSVNSGIHAGERAVPIAVQVAPSATHRMPRRQFSNLGDFLASEANRLAITAAETAATQPGTYTPLTFVGPPGSGKTHLLEGIWRRVREARSLARVIYLSAEQFTNQFLDALKQSGTPNFRRKIRDVELLLIDDVQFFAGKQSTLVELVHTIDTLLRNGRQLVFAADRPPSALRALGPELVARLSGGLVCSLEPADFATRLGILEQLATRHGCMPSPDVLSWLAGQLNGDARQLAGALNRLRAASEAHQRPIDLDFAQAALDDLIHSGRRPVRLPDIVEAVCDVFGVPADELQSGSKAASVTLPRMLIMFLARKWTRAAHSEISRTLGRKSHSTVVSAQHKVTEWLGAGKIVPLAHGQCRVEDAIKRIETQLRVG
jgi:chromosomal replication initiator protein